MSRIRIIVDGDTLMDAVPGEWTTNPPDIETLKLRGTRNGQQQDWMLTIMSTIAKAATLAFAGQAGSDTTITVTTRNDGWTLDVQQ